MATIAVDIVSVEGHIWSGEANLLIAPGRMGEVGIAPRHAPMLTTLRPGDLRVQRDGQEELFFYVSGGILEVQPKKITVLADTALRAEQLDLRLSDPQIKALTQHIKTLADERALTLDDVDGLLRHWANGHETIESPMLAGVA